MILKIPCPNDNSWHLISNIKEIDYQVCDKKPLAEKAEKSELPCPLRWFNRCETMKTILSIYITYKDDSGECIYIDNDVYILSDKGDTIEHVYLPNK